VERFLAQQLFFPTHLSHSKPWDWAAAGRRRPSGRERMRAALDLTSGRRQGWERRFFLADSGVFVVVPEAVFAPLPALRV